MGDPLDEELLRRQWVPRLWGTAGRQLGMVIDANELGLEAVLYAIVGAIAGVVVLGLAISVLAARLGGRRPGLASVGFGQVVSLAALVATLVIARTMDGEATRWDWLWAIGLATAAAWCGRRLMQRTDAPS